MSELSSKALAVGASLMTASIIAGFSFIKDVESRLAIIEDDLGETVEVVGMLHPPQRASVDDSFVGPPVTYADNKKEKRKKILDRLKEQAEEKKKKKQKKKDETNANSEVHVTFY